MLLNSRQQNFYFRFPKGFFYPDVKQKYEFYLNKIPVLFDNIEDYINHSIQSVKINGFEFENSEQWLNEDRIRWKSGLRVGNQIEKSFTVTFKLLEGYLNYWIFYDQILNYWDLDNKDEFLKDVSLVFLDNFGYGLLEFKFRKIIINSISELNLTHSIYSGNLPDLSTFDVTFVYNYFEIEVLAENKKLFERYGLGQ